MTPGLGAREASRVYALAAMAVLCIVPSVLKLVWPGSATEPLPLRTSAVVSASPVQRLWFGEKLDLNTASADTLEFVRGIGPRLSQRIVVDRTAHGPFDSVADIRRVKGVGPVLASRVAEFFTTARPPSGNAKPTAGSSPRVSSSPSGE